MSDLRKLIGLNRKRAYIIRATAKRKAIYISYFGGESEVYRLGSKQAVRAARKLLSTSLYTEVYITKELKLVEYYDE